MIKKILLAVMLCAGFAPPMTAADETVTALVLRVRGDAWVEGGKGKFIPLKAGQLVVEGDLLSTGKGTLYLSMADKSTVTMGHWTEMIIKSQKVKKKETRTVFRLFSGIFKAIVSKLSKNSVYEVRTDMATAAVKGTEFSVEAEEGETSNVMVSKGVVNYQTLDGKNNVDVAKKQGSMVAGDKFMPTKDLPKEEWGELKKQWESTKIVHVKRQGLRRKLNRRRKAELKKLGKRLVEVAAFAAALKASQELAKSHSADRLARKAMRKTARKKEKEEKKKKKGKFWFKYERTTF